jgi:hypothetical protein
MHAANRALTGGQASTHDKDLASSVKLNYPAGFAFWSKTELRKSWEFQGLELAQIKKAHEALKQEEIRLRQALQKANENVSHYQDLYLEEIDKNREKRKDNLNVSYLKVAG